MYPMVVGHEIVGKVVKAGPKAEGFKEGDLVGIGAQCDSCLECEWCKDGTLSLHVIGTKLIDRS